MATFPFHENVWTFWKQALHNLFLSDKNVKNELLVSFAFQNIAKLMESKESFRPVRFHFG